MTKLTSIQKKLLEGLQDISGRNITPDENLLQGAIDSLAWVDLINLVEALATEKGAKIDLESLLVRKSLTLNGLLLTLGEGTL